MTSDSQRDLKEVPYLQSMMGWTVLVIVMLSALALGANRPVSWSLMAMALLPIFFVQIICDVITSVPRNAYRLWLPAVLYIGVLVWAGFQTIPINNPELAHPVWALIPDAPGHISADPIKGYQHILRLAAYAMVFWIILRASTNVDRAMNFLKAIAIWTFALAVFGLGSLAAGSNIILGDDAAQVVTASFMNRNSYATYAVFGSVANLAMYLHIQNSSGNVAESGRQMLREFIERFFAGSWVFAVGFLVCFASLLATQSRAGAAAGILGLATFLAVYRGKKTESRNYAFITVAVVSVFVLGMMSAGVASRIMATSEESLRFIIYPIITEGVFDRPILGNGLGAFHNVFRTDVPLSAAGAEWELAHNSYLENAFELGIPGAAVFYLSLAMLTGVVVWGCNRRRHHRTFSCFALACAVTAGFHALFDFSLQMPAIAGLFAVIMAMGCAHAWRRQSNRSSRSRSED